jgi:hypothetical protein
MDRRDRERYDYGADYSRGEGYSRDDAHYHSARNLTNEFEREYQGERGRRGEDSDRPYRSYHEGNELGDMYERLSEGRGAVRSDTSYHIIAGERDWDNADRYSRDRDRYSQDRNDFRGGMGSYRSGREEDRRDNMRRDYDSYGRYGGVGSDDIRGNRYYGLPNATDNPGSDRGSYYGSRNYGGFGAMQEENRYSRDRRDQDRDDWSDSYRNRYY